MQGNRSVDTRPELAVRSAAYALGLRYRVRVRPVPALRCTPDMVFTGARVAVFVDGCFWHGCPSHYKTPSTNTQYWAKKIEGNRVRDRKTDGSLSAAGWTVIRIWEHEPPRLAAQQIAATVRAAAMRVLAR
jgi:DNA mismatch endonuclease (patch repair protein)